MTRIVFTIILDEVLALFIDCIICQMHTEVVKIATKR